MSHVTRPKACAVWEVSLLLSTWPVLADASLGTGEAVLVGVGLWTCSMRLESAAWLIFPAFALSFHDKHFQVYKIDSWLPASTAHSHLLTQTFCLLLCALYAGFCVGQSSIAARSLLGWLFWLDLLPAFVSLKTHSLCFISFSFFWLGFF